MSYNRVVSRARPWVSLLCLLMVLVVACAPAAPSASPTQPPKPTTPAKAEAPTPTTVAAKPTAAASPTAQAKPSGAADEWGVVRVRKGQTIKIGMGTALSGDNANLGIDERNGAMLAIEDKGTVKGFKVEMLVEDDQCTGEGGTAVANKFAANPEIVGVVGMMCSSGSIPASDIFERAHIPMISPSSTAPAFTARGLAVANRVAWNDNIQGREAAKFAREELKVSKSAIIHDGSPYGQGLAEVFQKSFQELGGQVVAFEGIRVGDKDFRPVLTKIATQQPELIYFGGFQAEGALLVSQKNDVGMQQVLFMGADGIKSDQFIEAAGGAAEGAYVSFADVAETEEMRRFRERYRERYNQAPEQLGPFHAHAYDAVALLIDAIDRASEIDQATGDLIIGRKKLADAIRATKGFRGLTGTLSCDANGDCGIGKVVMHVVRNGKFETVS